MHCQSLMTEVVRIVKVAMTCIFTLNQLLKEQQYFKFSPVTHENTTGGLCSAVTGCSCLTGFLGRPEKLPGGNSLEVEA